MSDCHYQIKYDTITTATIFFFLFFFCIHSKIKSRKKRETQRKPKQEIETNSTWCTQKPNNGYQKECSSDNLNQIWPSLVFTLFFNHFYWAVEFIRFRYFPFIFCVVVLSFNSSKDKQKHCSLWCIFCCCCCYCFIFTVHTWWEKKKIKKNITTQY